MKPCDHVDALLSAYIEHETSPAETRFVEEHLTGCLRCRRQLQGMQSLLETLARVPRVETSPDFTRRVLARTAILEPSPFDAQPIVMLRPRRPAWAVPLAAAATLALAFAALSQIARGPAAPPQTAERVTSPVAGRPEPVMVPEAAPSGPRTLPPVEQLPGDEANPVPLGTARDAYVLEGYELRQPAGGGSPILTRVAGGTDAQVVVTF